MAMWRFDRCLTGLRKALAVLHLQEGGQCQGVSCQGVNCQGVSCPGVSCQGVNCQGVSCPGLSLTSVLGEPILLTLPMVSQVV